MIVGAEFGFLQSLDRADTVWWWVGFGGAAMSLVGEIVGLTLGSFRRKDHFRASSYGTAGLPFLAGMVFPLFSLLGALLVYREARSVMAEPGPRLGEGYWPRQRTLVPGRHLLAIRGSVSPVNIGARAGGADGSQGRWGPRSPPRG